MGILSLLFKQRVRIGVNASAEFLPFGAVELDASLEEVHTSENEITQYPVERGVDISDHVRRQPDRVRIRGLVTDTPIFLPGFTGRSADAYNQFRRMLDDAELVSVVTTLRQYSDMVVESLEVPRRAGLGRAVELNLNLRQLLVATVALDAGTSDLGTQNPTAV